MSTVSPLQLQNNILPYGGGGHRYTVPYTEHGTMKVVENSNPIRKGETYYCYGETNIHMFFSSLPM